MLMFALKASCLRLLWQKKLVWIEKGGYTYKLTEFFRERIIIMKA